MLVSAPNSHPNRQLFSLSSPLTPFSPLVYTDTALERLRPVLVPETTEPIPIDITFWKGMLMAKPNKNSFFGGAAILAVAIVAVKILGALYKIPLGYLLTDAAFADFNNAYYIYGVMLLISTGGLPATVSKLVSEANALDRGNQIQKTLRVAVVAFSVIGLVCSAIMVLFPAQLADLMNNTHSRWSIMVLGPAVLFLCPLSAMRGYFQGHAQMVPTAISQVIEAAGKMIFGLTLAYILLRNGADESVCAAGAIAGITISSVISCLFVFFCYRRHRRNAPPAADTPDSTGAILKTLLVIAIPITLSSSVMSVADLIDTSLVQGRLQEAAGYTEAATRTLKGVYDKAVTIYNLPSQFMLALTLSVIPAVSAALSLKDYKQGAQVSETALRTTALLIIPAGAGLFVLGEPIIRLLYPTTDVELAGWCLSALAFGAVFVCLMQISHSILQAYHLMTIPLITTIIGCVLKFIITYTLVAIPDINIRGAAYSTICCFGLVTLLNLLYIRFKLPESPRYSRVFLKPLGCAIVMGIVVWGVYHLAEMVLPHVGPFGNEAGALSGLGNAAAVGGSILIGVVVYFAMVLVTHAISKDDVALMPKGDKIAKLLHIR